MTKTLILFLSTIVAIAIIGAILLYTSTLPQGKNILTQTDPESEPSIDTTYSKTPSETKTLATGLDTPWALAFLPDNSILVTERPGRLRLVTKDGILQASPVATIDDVVESGEGGLLGIAVHPNFSTNKYIYLYYTYEINGDDTRNRVVRFKLENNKLSDETLITNAIPGALFHNGGRIKFGPDNYLYITTGDAQVPSLAQTRTSLAGKILRVTDEGDPVPGNPFNTRVYSYGHRNPQGITWDEKGNLFETEHGNSTTDELNLISPGNNYGWPTITGKEERSGMTTPLLQSGTDTWAPGDIAYYKNQLFFTGLRGTALYKVTLTNNTPSNLTQFFKGEYGRIREVILGKDNMLYLTTSNKDGRGSPTSNDDQIIRINPESLK